MVSEFNSFKREPVKMATEWHSLIAEHDFIRTLRKIREEGVMDENPRPRYKDGTPANSIFVTDIYNKYSYFKGELPFALLRPVAVKMAINEIMVFFQEQTSDIAAYEKRGLFWWKDWDIGNGTHGLRYGATVKRYDLMNKLLKELEDNPFGRRHLINLWQEQDFEDSEGLPPCAFLNMFSVRKQDGIYFLDISLVQRSSDFLVASAINKVNYLALGLMVCSHLRFHTGNNWQVGTFSHHIQNVHIYGRHLKALGEMLADRKPTFGRTHKFALNVDKDFYEIKLEDFTIELNYTEDNKKKLRNELELAI